MKELKEIDDYIAYLTELEATHDRHVKFGAAAIDWCYRFNQELDRLLDLVDQSRKKNFTSPEICEVSHENEGR